MSGPIEEIEVVAGKQLALMRYFFGSIALGGLGDPDSRFCCSLISIGYLIFPCPYLVHEKLDDDQGRVGCDTTAIEAGIAW